MDVQVYKHTFVSKNAAQRVKNGRNEWMNELQNNAKNKSMPSNHKLP